MNKKLDILKKFISTQGYKRNSPDVNNPVNVIPSNQITMKGVDFPVKGVDNLGNEQIMYPNGEYSFPGEYVVETPMMQGGGAPITYVGNRNDPRLRAYNDSMILHNAGNHLALISRIPGMTVEKYDDAMLEEDKTATPSFNRLKEFNATPPIPLFTSYINLPSSSSSAVPSGYHVWKKPVSPIKYADPKIVEKQKLLKEAGLYTGALDGIWGKKSEAAWLTYNTPKEEVKPTPPTSNTKIRAIPYSKIYNKAHPTDGENAYYADYKKNKSEQYKTYNAVTLSDGTVISYDEYEKKYPQLQDGGPYTEAQKIQSGWLDKFENSPEVFRGKDLKPVTIKAKKPLWANLEEKYTNEELAKLNANKNWGAPTKLGDVVERRAATNAARDLIAQKYPNLEKDIKKNRVATLNKMLPKERELIERSDYASKIATTYGDDFRQGVTDFSELLTPAGWSDGDKRIYDPSRMTQEEANNSSSWDMLAPLSVPSKVVQSMYKPGYTMADALSGKKNNADGFEDIVTDLAAWTGVGAGIRGAKLAGKVVTPIMYDLSKSKNIREAIGSFIGIPPERTLARLPQSELKIYRQVQDIGRMRAINNDIYEQYRYALTNNIPENHLQQIFGKSKSEIETAIQNQGVDIKPRETINLQRSPRRVPSTSIGSDYDNINIRDNSILTEIERYLNNSADRTEFNLDNILIPGRTRPQRTIKQTAYEDVKDIYRHMKDFKTDIRDVVLNKIVSKYPTVDQDVIQNVPELSLSGSRSLKGVSNKVNYSMRSDLKTGDVFTGSLNTSHSSYLPQLKQVFKFTDGDPVFLGYNPMNELGFLSDYNYSKKDIGKYLNTEIDLQIKRGVIPSNIQRPYIKNHSLLLPQYGIKKKQNGGEWLNKYEQ